MDEDKAELTPVVGKWALVHGGQFGGILRPYVGEITAATAKTFAYKGTRFVNGSRVPHLNLLAMFDSREEAEQMAQRIGGVRGEMERRVSAAKASAVQQARKLLASVTYPTES